MIDDSDLLRSYLKEGSQEAFTALVNRHLNFVYATALRMTGARHRAQDVTQNVFTDLCRKASHLADRRNLVGWLYISAQMSAMKLAREESRRERREHNAEALESSASEPNTAVDWGRVAPVLDTVLAKLPSRDREAILLRFFKNASFAEVAIVLNTSENSARMRVSRAMEKARTYLAERGVVSTAAALELALSSQAATTVAPLSAGGISGTALAAASVSSTSIISIFRVFRKRCG